MASRKLRGRTKNSNYTRDANDDNSSSDDDLPSHSSLFTPTKAAAPKRKNQKSVQELLEEHTSLAQTIKGDNISQSHVEERLKRIKMKELHHEEKEPEQAPIVEEDYNIFCVHDVLQFFNSRDVTPALCGYNDKSENLSVQEKDMLSFIRVELENVISSFLLTCDPCTISDCKSFVTFLLRSISVSSDAACINACYYTLISMLTDHPHAENISFSSAEIFMVLFNYGIDVENCQILQYRPGLKKQLSAPTSQSKSCNRIPKNWTFNLEYILRSLIKLMSTCDIKSKDLCNILIFFLWMSFDPKLHAENLYPILQECISASVEHVPEDKWTITLLDIANTLVSMDSPSEKLKWNTIYSLAESIPSLSQKCGYLRRQISFLALSHLCYGEKADISSDSKFTIEEFKNLLQQMVEIQSDSSLSLAANFVDLCASHLNAKEEEYNDLCVILKRSENTLHEKAYMAKSHLCKIHSRLKRMACKSSVYTLSSFKKSSIYNLIKVKKEKDIKPKDDTCILDPVRIKVESDKHPNNVKSEKQDDINMFAVEEPVYAEDSFQEEKFSPVKQPEGIQLTGVYSAEDASAIFSPTTQPEETLVYVHSYGVGENLSNLDIREAPQISNGVIVDNLCMPSDNYAVGNPTTESSSKAEIASNIVTQEECAPCAILVNSVTSCAGVVESVTNEMIDDGSVIMSCERSALKQRFESTLMDSTPVAPVISKVHFSSNTSIKMTVKEESQYQDFTSKSFTRPNLYNSTNTAQDVNTSDPISSLPKLYDSIYTSQDVNASDPISPLSKLYNSTESHYQDFPPESFTKPELYNTTDTSPGVNASDPISSLKIVDVQSEAQNCKTSVPVGNSILDSNKSAKHLLPESQLPSVHENLFSGLGSTENLFSATDGLFSACNSGDISNSKGVSYESDTLSSMNVNSFVKEILRDIDTSSNNIRNTARFDAAFLEASAFEAVPISVVNEEDKDEIVFLKEVESPEKNKNMSKESSESTPSNNVDEGDPQIIFVKKVGSSNKSDRRHSSISQKSLSKVVNRNSKASDDDEITVIKEVESAYRKPKTKPPPKKSSKKISSEQNFPILNDTMEKIRCMFPLSKDMVVYELPGENISSKRSVEKPKIEDLYKRSGLSITTISNAPEADEEIVILKEIESPRKKHRGKNTGSSSDVNSDSDILLTMTYPLLDKNKNAAQDESLNDGIAPHLDTAIVIDSQVLSVINGLISGVQDLCEKDSMNASSFINVTHENIESSNNENCANECNVEKIKSIQPLENIDNILTTDINVSKSVDPENSNDRLIVSESVLENVIQEVALQNKISDDHQIQNQDVADLLNCIVTSLDNTNQLSILNDNNEVTPKVSEEKSNLSSNQKSVVDSVEVNEANFISPSSCSLLNSTQMYSDSKKLDVSNEKENNEEVKIKMSVHVKTPLAAEKSTDHIPPLNTDKDTQNLQSISKVVGHSPKKISLALKRKSYMKISRYSNILDPNKNKSNIPAQSIKKDSSILFSKMNLKRKNSEPNSVTKIQRVSSPRKSEVQSENHPKHFRYKSSFKIQLTPKKSNLLAQNIYAINKRKSPFKRTFRLSPKKPLFGARRNFKSQSLLSKTGLQLSQYLREKLLPSSSQSKSNSISKVPEIFVNSDSDSDIEVLYTDPKKYSDSDCMIVYETEEQVVLD